MKLREKLVLYVSATGSRETVFEVQRHRRNECGTHHHHRGQLQGCNVGLRLMEGCRVSTTASLHDATVRIQMNVL